MKFIFKFDDLLSENTDINENVLIINNQLHTLLMHYKNSIEVYYKNKKWDISKKLANKYEYVYSLNSKKPKISRSYYKLWEIMSDFNINVSDSNRSVFLADGPGGFIESFIDFRNANKVDKKKLDKIFGISLISSNPNVPKWKFSQSYIDNNNIFLLYGVDNTGSLYNINNIIDFVKIIGSGSSEFITADGGFDFSTDFNNQEKQSFQLILCEVYTALQIQKKSGIFILKVFDISTIEVMKIIYILYQSYEDVYITKPYTSRPANSEKYIVCKGFKGIKHNTLSKIKAAILRKDNNIDIDISGEFINDIVFYNIHCVLLQIFHIKGIISLIEDKKIDVDFIIKKQIKYATEYCNNYGIENCYN